MPDDRQGIARSMVERMERAGGSVRGPTAPRGRVRRWSWSCPVPRRRVTGPERLRVFVVDDHALVRSGIRAELGDDVDVVGEADEVGAAVEMILERSPDVVLLDVHMPGRRRAGRPGAGAAGGPDGARSWPCRCPMPPRT